jgi:hypothetical protein
MNATAIVTFPDRERAFDALKALQTASGSMAVGSIVATKELNGNLRVTETSKHQGRSLGAPSRGHSSAHWPVCLLGQGLRFSAPPQAH